MREVFYFLSMKYECICPFFFFCCGFARLDYAEKLDLYLPSGIVNSLKVGKEMKVWDTECVGSRTQAMSLG